MTRSPAQARTRVCRQQGFAGSLYKDECSPSFQTFFFNLDFFFAFRSANSSFSYILHVVLIQLELMPCFFPLVLRQSAEILFLSVIEASFQNSK